MRTNSYTKFAFFLFLLYSASSFAGNHTWTGTTNTDWATGTNWSPNVTGGPTTNDTVTIVTNTNQPLLAANTTIKKFTMTSGTLDCNGYTITISATASFNGGTINNGTLTCSGTSTLTFAGTTFGAAVNATGNNILLNGSVFNSTLTAVKKGSSSDNGTGNNIFNGAVTLTDSGTGGLVLSNNSSAPDTFNSTLTVSATSSGGVYLAHQGTGNVFNGNVTFSTGNVFSNTYGTAAYNGNVTLNSASANISFGNSTGSCTLASGKNISIGTFSAGTLTIRNLTQSDNSISMRLALSGTAKLVLGSGNSISANLYASSNQLTFSGSRFLGADTLIFTGGNSATSSGGNYFGSTVYIANTFSGSNYHFTLGSTNVDTFTTTTTLATTGNTSIDVEHGLFLGAVTFKNSITSTGSDRFYVQDCTFKGALTLDGIFSGINFRAGTGNTVLDSTAALSLVSGYAGQLTLSYIEQRGSNAINLNMSTNTSTGNNTILTIGSGATFNANFNYLGQRLELNGGTFNGNASFTRFSQSLDVCLGGNVFNGTTQICDSVGATSSNRVFKLANTNPDDFNGNVTFKQYGTGSSASTMKMYPAYGANSTFAGNVTVESNNVPIEFGANGGRVILDGSINDTLKKTGSYLPTIKKLDINKTGGAAILNLPLAITDSVLFTSGYLKTDSVNLLTIADNCIVTGASDYSAIVGPIKKVGNDAFTFPFGELWTGPPPVSAVPDYVYHPLTISAPSNATDAFTAQYFSANHNKGTNADSTIENESVCEYWKLTRTNGSSNVTVKLGWNWTSCNVFGMDSMHVAVWDTATAKWKDKGNGGTTGTLTSGGVVSSSALSIFGVMTLVDKFCTTLKPVATATDVTCPGNSNGTTRVSASGATPPYTYNWSPRTGGSVSLWDLTSGTYHITVTDSRGCAITDSAIVNNPDSIHLSITATPSNCHDSVGTAKITATGGSSDSYYYFWTPGGETKDSIGGLPAGIYEVVVSDAKGCSVDTTVSISDSDGPDVEVDSLVNVDCNGSNTGFAKTIFTGDPVEHDPLWPCYVPNPDRIAAGTYPVMMEDGQGCFAILDVTITEPPPIVLSVSSTQSQCGDSTGTATVVASGGTGSFTYNWSSGGASNFETNIPSGYDTVVVTDQNGCLGQAVITITDTNSLTLSVFKTDALCFDSTGSASITVAGGSSPYTYKWFPNGVTTSNIDSLIAGEYTVVVMDSLGCTQKNTFSLSSPSPLLIRSFKTDASTDSTADGTARVEVTGGSPPYSYLWSPGSQTTSSVSALSPGYYSVLVSDNTGCTRYIGPIIIGPNNCGSGLAIGCYGIDNILPAFSTITCVLDPSSIYGCQTLHDCSSLSIIDFGANPSDGASDECAFEAAATYIQTYVCGNSNLSSFTLNFPPGQYDIGRETPFGQPAGAPVENDCYFGRGHDIFFLTPHWLPLAFCSNIIFHGIPDVDGTLPKFKYPDCLKYGSFDPNTGGRYLPAACQGFADCRMLAYPGDIFRFENADNITIENLDLDGNVSNASIGGYSSTVADGIQQPYDGISLYNTTRITIRNVNSHDFGRDGISVAPQQTNAAAPMNLTLINSKFNNNRRNGFSWTSGQTVRALFCQFNSNGIGEFTSSPSCGIDLEWEANILVSDGHFYDCEMKFNGRAGIESSSSTRGTRYDGNVHDMFFTRCTAVAGDRSVALWPGARKMEFTCCNFYGRCQYAYNGYFNIGAFNNWNTKFLQCSFNEEYNTANGIKSFRYDARDGIAPHFPLWDCSNSSAYGMSYAIVQFDQFSGAGRVLFDQCSFNTTYFNMLVHLVGSPNSQPLNFQTLQNCTFTNSGMDGGTDLIDNSFAYVRFVGSNILYRPVWARNNLTQHYYGGYPAFAWNIIGLGTTACNSDPTCFTQEINISEEPCHDRYETYPPVAYYWNLTGEVCDFPYYNSVAEYCLGWYSGACTGWASNNCFNYCPECEVRKGNTADENSKQNYIVYPVPAQSSVFIENTKEGDNIILRSMLGDELIKTKATGEKVILIIDKLPPGVYCIQVNGVLSEKIAKY